MRLLVDTQIVQYLALDRRALSIGERQVLDSPRNEFWISAVSLWEMLIKWQTFYRSGDRKGEADPERVVGLLAEVGFQYAELPMTFEHCITSIIGPLDNTDRVDRLLLAQAQVEGLRLLTRDHKFAGHPLALFG